MAVAEKLDPKAYVGRSLDRLSLNEREALVGKYVAREIYTPKTLPLQRIEALGDSVAECVALLRHQGKDPLRCEFFRLNPPY